MRRLFQRGPRFAGCAALLLLAAAGADARRTGGPRSEPIDLVVIHSTGGPICDAATRRVVWVQAGTLAENMRVIEAHPKLGIHYMIDRDGTVVKSVPEDRLAHHVFRYSERSIGIELINDGDGRDPFPEAQIAALVNLLRDIASRRGISRDGIKRHSDLDRAMLACAAGQRRKVDPGDAFPFEAVVDRVYSAPVVIPRSVSDEESRRSPGGTAERRR